MIPQKLALTPFTEGDTWKGIPQINVTVGPVGGPFLPPEATLTLVTMRFRKVEDGITEPVELSNFNPGQIEIIDAPNWQFVIHPQIIPGLTHGKWKWRIRCIDAGDVVETYLADEITILETV